MLLPLLLHALFKLLLRVVYRKATIFCSTHICISHSATALDVANVCIMVGLSGKRVIFSTVSTVLSHWLSQDTKHEHCKSKYKNKMNVFLPKGIFSMQSKSQSNWTRPPRNRLFGPSIAIFSSLRFIMSLPACLSADNFIYQSRCKVFFYFIFT